MQYLWTEAPAQFLSPHFWHVRLRDFRDWTFSRDESPWRLLEGCLEIDGPGYELWEPKTVETGDR